MILKIFLTIFLLLTVIVSCISTIKADNGSTVNNSPTNTITAQKDVEQNRENTDNTNTNTTVETSTTVDFSKSKK